MSETNDTTRRSKTLSLKKTETSTVKQSFSHGRTKAVVVEKKRTRVAPAAAKPAADPAPAPAQPEPVVPAKPTPAPLLSPEQVRRIERYDSRGQPLLGERIAATRALLEREPDERYSVELFITDNTDPARMERFLARARDLALLPDVYVIPLASGRRYRLRVLYGDFPDRSSALEGERKLPAKYQEEFRTTARSFADLRRPM